jgi:hypothetical protein
MKKFILLILLITTLVSCLREGEDCHKDLLLSNETSTSKYVYVTETRISAEDFILCSRAILEPYETLGAFYAKNNCLETRINNIFHGALVIYTFNEDQGDNDCELLASNPNLIETREYTVEDLNSMDWIIPIND